MRDFCCSSCFSSAFSRDCCLLSASSLLGLHSVLTRRLPPADVLVSLRSAAAFKPARRRGVGVYKLSRSTSSASIRALLALLGLGHPSVSCGLFLVWAAFFELQPTTLAESLAVLVHSVFEVKSFSNVCAFCCCCCCFLESLGVC